MVKMNKKSVYTCETCSALYVCLKYFQEHRKKHAIQEGRTIFPCTHCQTVHTSEHESHLHSISHKNEQPHSCEVCQEILGISEEEVLGTRRSIGTATDFHLFNLSLDKPMATTAHLPTNVVAAPTAAAGCGNNINAGSRIDGLGNVANNRHGDSHNQDTNNNSNNTNRNSNNNFRNNYANEDHNNDHGNHVIGNDADGDEDEDDDDDEDEDDDDDDDEDDDDEDDDEDDEDDEDVDDEDGENDDDEDDEENEASVNTKPHKDLTICKPNVTNIIYVTNQTINHNTTSQKNYLKPPRPSRSTGKGKGNRKARLTSDGDIRRKFSCCHCGKSFKTKSHLQRHILTHTGEKPYHCNRCDCRFNQSSSLRNHVIAIHTKEYPHTCNNCSKGFLMPAVLQKHLQTSECGKLTNQVVEGL